MDVTEAITTFQNILTHLSEENSPVFLNWVKENIHGMLERHSHSDNTEVILESIREDVRGLLPLNATTPTENIYVPQSGPNSDCDDRLTVHVDAFCYDDDDIDSLCDKGLMSRNVCVNCGSKNVQPLTFITHSISVRQLKYVFHYLLPDLRGKTILDVGSRTGAVLYGANLFSDASCIIGVEIDPTFCQLQQHILTKYQFETKTQVIQQDIRSCDIYVQQADVVILNNVFEFFMPCQEQKSVWEYLHKNLRKTGSIILTVPSIPEALHKINLQLDLDSWIRILPTTQMKEKANLILYGDKESLDSDLQDINMYQVL